MNADGSLTAPTYQAFEISFEGYFRAFEEEGRERRSMFDGFFWVMIAGRDVEASRTMAVDAARARLEDAFDVASFSRFLCRYDGKRVLDDDARDCDGIWQSGMVVVRFHSWGPRRWWYAARALWWR
jgi:hypothetical protein